MANSVFNYDSFIPLNKLSFRLVKKNQCHETERNSKKKTDINLGNGDCHEEKRFSKEDTR